MTAVRLRVVGPVESECPDDGGRWALYCDHHDGDGWFNGGLIQDTNRRRLAGWRNAIDGRGLTVWCPECQAIGEAGGTGLRVGKEIRSKAFRSRPTSGTVIGAGDGPAATKEG